MQDSLVHVSEQDVKFSETDPLSVVWHGNYIRYFEDGREAFGKEYGISYLQFFEQGFVVPVVNVQCDYRRSIRYGDRLKIETTYLPTEAAKLKFTYRLFNAGSGELVAEGSTLQVFLDKQESQLQLNNPPFFEVWKKKHSFI